MTALLLLAACGTPALPALAPAPADLTLEVTEKQVDAEEPVVVVVETWSGEGWTVPPPQPAAEGLNAILVAQDGPTRVGERERRTWSWELTGPVGSYIVAVGEVEATGPGDQTRALAPPPVFVDIGVPGPVASGLADFEAAPPPEPPPYRTIAAVAGGTVVLAGLLAGAWWYRRSRPTPEAPPDPPDVQARRAWAEARAADLDDHALALALSRILRVYVEQTQGFPATARTTREILQHLDDAARLGPADRARAAAVLDATDRLKFAREGGGAAFFTRLGDDFEAIVIALRPRLAAPEDDA